MHYYWMKLKAVSPVRFFGYMAMLVFAAAIVVSCDEDKIDRLQQPPNPEGLPVPVQVFNMDTKEPVEGLELIIQRRVSSDEFADLDSGLTDASGKITFHVPAPNEVRVVLPDTTFYANKWADLELETGQANAITMDLFPKFGEAPVNISVRNALEKAPVEGAYVALRGRQPGEQVFKPLDTAYTDASGNVSFIVDFPVEIMVDLEETQDFSYVPGADNITVKAGSAIEMLTFPRINVPLKITNLGTGEPLPETELQFWTKTSAESDFSVLSSSTTDANGQVTIPLVPAPGLLRVVITDLDYPTGEPLVEDIKTGNPAEIVYAAETAFTPETIQDRGDWSIIEVDDDDAGPVENILDGNGGSVWHSQWRGSPPPFPHHFVIDTKKFTAFNAVLFKNRNNRNGAIKTMEILVSDNAFAWKSLGLYTPLNHSDYQVIPLTQHAQGRYIKVIAHEGYNATNAYVNLAEFGIF